MILKDRGARRAWVIDPSPAGIVRPCAVAYLPIGEGWGMVRTADRIAGGFVPVSVASLVAAWRACRARPLGVGDFRTWLACREIVARRCGLEQGRAPAYGLAELARLMGVTEKRAKGSIGRLVAAGLLQWSDSAIAFPDPPGDPTGLDDTIGKGRGSVAIPRRILRLLAGGARPALIATALGLLLRCLSRRRRGFDGRGRVKAAWIARAFGIDLRRVKQARLELVALGWVAVEPSDQRAENRWGRAYRIDLAWDRVRAGGRSLPPLLPPGRPAIATPSVDPEPLPEREINQEPAGRGPAGVQARGTGEETRPLPTPNLDDVRPEDLRDVGRTLALFDQAVKRRLASPSEDGRLKFLAIAEHARAVGTVNPGGLFARLVRRGWWHFATQDDEDVARRRLRGHLHGRPGRVQLPGPGTFEPDGPTAVPTSLGDAMGSLLARWPST